jgi:serine/threonine protein kinase
MAKRIAVIVGIDAYQEDPLSFCANDARELARTFASRNYGFDVRLILDDASTRSNIRKAIDEALSERPECFLFAFAGHGISTDVGTYLASIDAADPEDGLPLDYLRRIAEVRISSDQSLVYILDCCHSGGILAAGRPVKSTDIVSELGVVGGTGRIVLAACRDDQLAAEEPQLQHGLFSFHILMGLLGEAADSSGEVTVTALHDYVSRALKDVTDQVPVLKGDLAGRLVLGTGFPPIIRAEVPDEILVQKEREGAQHVDDFRRLYADEQRDSERWNSGGFLRACTSLEAALRWFASAAKRMSALERRPVFVKAYGVALEYRRELTYLKPGVKTVAGAAVEKLGHGGFGSVWRLRETDGRELAYKVFHPQDLDEDEKTKRFRQGFEAMRLLDHPRVVRVHQFTESPFGYTMDFIDGPNLRKFTGTVTEPAELVSLLLTIAETLAHAHSRTVIHRDVKPENIILEYAGEGWQPYLTDFDLAWFSTASELTKSELAFAMYYAPPEQRDSPRSSSARKATVDVYSFGQLMHFVLTSQDPNIHPAKTRVALQNRLAQGWSEQPARRMVQLYTRCTETSPVDRYSGFREICDELRELGALLQGKQRHAPILADRFPQELAFSVSGLDSEYNAGTNQFSSRSAKITIGIAVDPLENGQFEVKYTLYCIESPFLPGLTHDSMRQTMLSRIDRILKEFPGTEKRPGTRSPFEVKILQHGLPATFGGVETSAALLSRILDVLERGA